jgi:hypothetical protein
MTFGIHKSLKWFWLIVAANLGFIFWSQSTFDAGDSIMHYLHARQSWHYPKYFLSHWSKPFFVLIAGPFAQFGFTGIKVFNTLCVGIAVWFTYLIVSKKTGSGWLVILLLYFAPEYFLSQASGLTEPLFSSLLMAAIWCYLDKRFVLSLLIASFLPFIRSEGWLVAPVFGLIALLDGRYKDILWLMTGHLLYGIAGLFYYQDFLWMFHQNPYQGIEEKYGSGDLFHYIIQTPYMIGIPAAVLLSIGLVRQLFFCREILKPDFRTRIVLIYVTFLVFLIAHSLFWYFGIFHSFGMRRVFIAVIPLMALIAFDGLSYILSFSTSANLTRIMVTLISITVVTIPFSDNKTAYRLEEDFQLSQSQQTIKSAVKWFQSSSYKDRVVSYGHVYFSMILNKDMDNSEEVVSIGCVKSNEIRKGTIVFWDSFFSINQMRVTKEQLELSPSYKRLMRFNNRWRGETFEIIVYEKID